MKTYRCPADLLPDDHLPEGWSRGRPLVIEHSGCRFVTKTWAGSGVPVWPMEELFARHPFKRTVRERIQRLNPLGKPEGEGCRGWHFNKACAKAFLMDAVPMRKYIAKWGTVVGAEIMVKKGRQKYVSRHSFNNGPL